MTLDNNQPAAPGMEKPTTIQQVIDNLRNPEIIGNYSRLGSGGGPSAMADTARILEELQSTAPLEALPAGFNLVWECSDCGEVLAHLEGCKNDGKHPDEIIEAIEAALTNDAPKDLAQWVKTWADELQPEGQSNPHVAKVVNEMDRAIAGEPVLEPAEAPQAAGDVFHSDPDIELTDGAADEFIEAMQPPSAGFAVLQNRVRQIREIIGNSDLSIEAQLSLIRVALVASDAPKCDACDDTGLVQGVAPDFPSDCSYCVKPAGAPKCEHKEITLLGYKNETPIYQCENCPLLGNPDVNAWGGSEFHPGSHGQSMKPSDAPKPAGDHDDHCEHPLCGDWLACCRCLLNALPPEWADCEMEPTAMPTTEPVCEVNDAT